MMKQYQLMCNDVNESLINFSIFNSMIYVPFDHIYNHFKLCSFLYNGITHSVTGIRSE
eukprot:UN08801